ncbi:DMT family transporter [Sagittula salina]|uniref:DMT family transporter n=1 Tax=Sagittula salina TaxID=2820268 RepID=A0A940MPB1_9RHOB|nr:DMT family transporter [Sagittula salina]MBP0483390.1 DMT family transporter [Sagittula salina]
MTPYAVTMLLAGVGIPVLAALNAALGQHLGNAVAAGMVLFCVALICATVTWLVTGAGGLTGVVTAPGHLFVAGALVAFYVLSITFIAPRFGVGNAVFFVLIGQLVSAAVIDHFGLFGARMSPLTVTRATGIAVMGLGVWITQMAPRP